MINLKALMEKRAEQQQIMENLLHTADTETRAMSEEEAAQFDAAEKEIRAIDETIAREERARKVEKKAVPSEAEERAADEERAFADYVMGKVPEPVSYTHLDVYKRQHKRRLPMINATSDVLFALSCFILAGFALTVGRMIAELLLGGLFSRRKTDEDKP